VPVRAIAAAIAPATRGAAKEVLLQRAQPRNVCGTPVDGCDASVLGEVEERAQDVDGRAAASTHQP
jgi:hypothetical protein